MEKLTGSLFGRVALRFGDKSGYVPSDLSAALRAPGGSLILAADERASLEVLRGQRQGTNTYAEHRSYALNEVLGIGADEEADIEGVTCDEGGSALFVIGSHSAKRKKPKGKSVAKDLERLATVQTDASRFVLARVPLHEDEPVLGRDAPVALLPQDGPESLLGMLENDAHLGPFIPGAASGFTIPGKDNGLDIEGVVRFKNRLLVGLRGPVLRGYALVLDFELAVSGSTLSIVDRGRQRYRKHALNLDGLGVRELIVDGDDVLVLAGPTMTLDGAHRVFRWHNGPSGKQDTLVSQDKGKLTPLFDVPFTRGFDRAEGMARCSWFDEDDSLLMVYDAPSAARRLGPCAVLADVFAL